MNNKPKVLIIDDEAMIRLNLKLFLEEEGYVVETAGSAEEGLALIDGARPDVAIVDMRLPAMDGTEFIIRAAKILPTLRYIVHTGSLDYAIPPELIPLGVRPEHILGKPILRLEMITEIVDLVYSEKRDS